MIKIQYNYTKFVICTSNYTQLTISVLHFQSLTEQNYFCVIISIKSCFSWISKEIIPCISAIWFLYFEISLNEEYLVCSNWDWNSSRLSFLDELVYSIWNNYFNWINSNSSISNGSSANLINFSNNIYVFILL